MYIKIIRDKVYFMMNIHWGSICQSYKVKWQHKMKLINLLKYEYFSTKSQTTRTHLSHLGTVYIFTAQESRIFYLMYSLSPLFPVLTHTTKLTVKTLGTVRVSCDTNEAVNFHENKIADGHLLSNLPTINVWSRWSLQSLWSLSL
jgi:hypothetical protein